MIRQVQQSFTRSRLGSVTVVAFALTLLLAGTAFAANPATNTTTTDQDLTVEIMLDPDPGASHWLGEPLEIDAWATLGEGDFANVLYVLDVSGSMENSAFNPFQDINPPAGIGPEDDCNADGVAGSALDSACFGLIAVSDSFGSEANIDMGMVVFGDGAKTADMNPAAGAQTFTSPPDVDNDLVGGPDVHQVVRSTDTELGGLGSAGLGLFTSDFTDGFAFETDYDSALADMNAAFAAEPPGEINRAFFLSDGEPSFFTVGPGSALEAATAAGTIVYTYGLGAVAPGSCSVGQPLRTIADATGGTCTEVADPSSLSTILPAALTNIATLTVELNGVEVGSTAGSEPLAMHVENIDIAGLVVPGLNLVEATAVAEDGTTVTADLAFEVVDMTLEPAHAVNELGSDNEHTVTATLLGSPGEVAGQTITFEVTGTNPVPPTAAITDGTGVAMFSYTVPVEPASIGTDTISATAIIDGHEATLEVTKDWVDSTPPEAFCLEGVNPNGKTAPKAPGNGGQAQNPDGFYQLIGSDDVWPADTLEIYVVDDGSGTVFGPFAVGTTIKWTEAAGATPGAKPIGSSNGQAGAVSWHITGNGDAMIYVVDGSGNASSPVSCLVPPAPA